MEPNDVDLITHYWINAEHDFLVGMGVDVKKIPPREELKKILSEQLSQSYKEKKVYCIIWKSDNQPIGHSNVNKIIFGEEAYMHLHLWNTKVRKRGMGLQLVKMTLPYFFINLKLKKLFCEPYSINIAPNKLLKKIGFDFVKEYLIIPGWINFEQKVNRWELSYERFKNETDHPENHSMIQ